jgi:hypothetical protein
MRIYLCFPDTKKSCGGLISHQWIRTEIEISTLLTEMIEEKIKKKEGTNFCNNFSEYAEQPVARGQHIARDTVLCCPRRRSAVRVFMIKQN